MGRPPCCDKSNVKRGLWTPEEDAKILAYVSNHGIGNWTLVPKKAGLNRCGKSCRLRWTNYLRPDLKHDNFTPQEEELIIDLHKAIGSRWSLIAKRLPGRTDNDVKNFWNTKLRKKLSKMGIDPLTHKPFSQIISDYGNISVISNSGSPTGSLNKPLNNNNNTNILFSKSEHSCVTTGPSSSGKILKPSNLEQKVQDIHPSWDFLPQFQFTNHDIIQPHFFNEVSSSCSSSSSNTFTQLNSPKSYSCQQSQPSVKPCSPCLWSEFLVSDPALSVELQQQQQDHESKRIVSSSTLAERDAALGKLSDGNESLRSHDPKESIHGNISSYSASSFVDGILDKDREMRSEFPELLDGSFDY